MQPSLQQLLAARIERLARNARKDCASFVEFCMQDELTQMPIKNAAIHREWHEFLDGNDSSVIFSPVESGKSTQIAVARTIWELGRNRNTRCAIISNTSAQAEKLLRGVRANIEKNENIAYVFPELKRSTSERDPWSNSALTVERDSLSRDPSVQCCGVGGPINGSRLDRVVLDDVCDFENTRTSEQRKKLISWFDSTVLTRLTNGSRIYVIGTPWDDEDLLHVLAARGGYCVRRYSSVIDPEAPPDQWVPQWPDQWPMARLLERKTKMTDHDFARKYLCRVLSSHDARFRGEWVDACIQRGKGRTLLPKAPVDVVGRPWQCFTGVDLGPGQRDESALTVVFTVARMGEGYQVVDIQSGRWSAPDIVQRLSDVYARYNSVICVEDNGAQRFVVDMCQGRVPVKGLTTTGATKNHIEFGVEAMGVDFRECRWTIPSGTDGKTLHPEVEAWCSALRRYNPTTHTDDRIMASWIAREAARRFGGRSWGHVDTQSR